MNSTFFDMNSKELATRNPVYMDVEASIKRVKNSKDKYVLLHRGIRILVLIAGGTITLLTGWKLNDGAEINGNIVLAISTLITVAAAIENLFDMRDKAMGYYLLLFDLRKLRDDMIFEYIKNTEMSKEKQTEFYERYQLILASQKSILENAYKNGD